MKIRPDHPGEGTRKRSLERRLTQWLLKQFCQSAGLSSMMVQPIAPRKSLRVMPSVIRGSNWFAETQDPDRNFASKAHAVSLGFERVNSFQFEIVGNLDADVSFEPDYMEFLIQKFSEDPGARSSPELLSPRTEIMIRAKTALRVRITSPDRVNFSGVSVSRKSAAMFRTEPEGLIGSRR